VPASPYEQIIKCAFRPARVSFAMTPPQPNSMSSGCAPKASNGASAPSPPAGERVSAGRVRGRFGLRDFGVGFIGLFNGIAGDKLDFGRVFLAKVGFFAGAGNVMRAMQNRLHPAQPRVARRA